MLYQIKSYFTFLWYSKNEHAVHSPFVFNLITKCFYDKKLKTDPSESELAKQYQVLKEYRKSLLENKNSVEVTNFDADSEVFQSNTKQIRGITKTNEISPKRAKLLFRIANYFQPTTILEIGSSLGITTSALALGNPKAIILSLECCTNALTITENLFRKKFSNSNYEFINTEYEYFLKSCSLQPTIFNLIYFDGNHSKTATLNYFELLLPSICNETIWIFNAIHRSEAMEEAWKIIKEHPKTTVTIDTFHLGFVFFRKEQLKEHFVIRI